MALGRVNLSRAPHCPAAFSLGNEVMETRLDLPFLRRTTRRTILLLPFFLALSPCLHSPSASFPSSVLSFYPLVTDRTPVCRNRIKFAVSSAKLRLPCATCPAGRAYENSYLQIVLHELCILRIFWTLPLKIKRRTSGNLRDRYAKLEIVSSDRKVWPFLIGIGPFISDYC